MQQVKIISGENLPILEGRVNDFCEENNTVFATQWLVRHNEIIAFCWYKTE